MTNVKFLKTHAEKSKCLVAKWLRRVHKVTLFILKCTDPLMHTAKVPNSQLSTKENRLKHRRLLRRMPWFHHSNSFISKIMEISPLTSPSNGNRRVGAWGGYVTWNHYKSITVHFCSATNCQSVHCTLHTSMVLLSATRLSLSSSSQSSF